MNCSTREAGRNGVSRERVGSEYLHIAPAALPMTGAGRIPRNAASDDFMISRGRASPPRGASRYTEARRRHRAVNHRQTAVLVARRGVFA